MDYRFTAMLIILLCLLAIFVRPASNPSLKLDKKDYIIPLPKPKVGIDNKAWNEIE
jgi:hypothetical protein